MGGMTGGNIGDSLGPAGGYIVNTHEELEGMIREVPYWWDRG